VKIKSIKFRRSLLTCNFNSFGTTVLIAVDGGNFEQFASRTIACRVSGKCRVNDHAHVLKVKEKLSLSFIFYSLAHKNILYFIVGRTRSKLTHGAACPGIENDDGLPLAQKYL
jgi:hypothetical protein